MARRAVVKQEEIVDIMQDDMDSDLDEMEKDLGLNQISLTDSRDRVSTGLLALDLMMSGGTTPGAFMTFFGGEQAAKSTLAQTVLNRAIIDNVPRLFYFDYEGSFQADYFESIGRSMGSTYNQGDIFGVKDESGRWVKKPKLRYYAEALGDKVFDTIYKLEKDLPSKLYREGKWWYVFEGTRDNKAQYKADLNVKLMRETGKCWIPAPDGKIQALIVCDSYPAMLFKESDEEQKKDGLGAQARAFAHHLKRIKGRMSEKRIGFLGVNQLREKPMVMFGSPFYEPCGSALKFFSDVRVQLTARAVLGGKGPVEEEDALGGGTDYYMYKNMKCIKNKLSTPNLEGWARIWTKDNQGKAHGFDPVFDTFIFLKEIGMVDGTKNRMKIYLPQMLEGEHKALTWKQFKILIIGTPKQKRAVFTAVGIKKMFDLRKTCFSLFKRRIKQKDGVIVSRAMKMYFDFQRGDVEELEEE